MKLVVTGNSLVFEGGASPIRCALGPAGISKNKKEGDGVTPAGKFPLRQVFYRADRVENLQTQLTVVAIKPNDGWCDDPADKLYNQYVQHPYHASAEHLWRTDHVYDICVVLGHNDDPPVPEKGSGIFFHLAHEDYRPTQGCVAISREDMLAILAQCRADTMMEIRDN